ALARPRRRPRARTRFGGAPDDGRDGARATRLSADAAPRDAFRRGHRDRAVARLQRSGLRVAARAGLWRQDVRHADPDRSLRSPGFAIARPAGLHAVPDLRVLRSLSRMAMAG